MRCLSCGTMNEPGFRFCGSCGARQDSGVSAGEPGQQKVVSDGIGIAAGAAEPIRPRRRSASAGMSSADSGGLGGLGAGGGMAGRSRRPLAILLVVDAALAIAGGLLLRAGLAKPAEASAAAATSAPTSAAPPGAAAATTSSSTAPGEGAPAAAQAEPAKAETAPAGDPAMKASSNAAPSAAAPNAAPSAAAPSSGFAPGEPAPGQPAGGAARSGGDDKTADKTTGAAVDAAAGTAKKKKKADTAVRRVDGPVDPYAPAADLSAQVSKLFSKGQAKLDRCHASIARGAGPTQLTVSFRVMADGSLGDIRVIGVPAGLEMLGPCVQAELSKWKVQSGESGEFVRRIQFAKVR